jgi:outer membrane protein TolC
VPGQWWKLYDDPQLDGLIEEAFKANTDLRVAAANIDRASAMIRQAHAQERFWRTSTPGRRSTAIRSPSKVFRAIRWSAAASLTYDFDVGGRIRSLTAAAGHDRDAAQAAYDLTRVNVAAGVAGAYADACAAGMLRARAQHSLGLLRRNLDFTNRLIAAGRGTPLDRDNAEVLVAQLEAQMPGFDTAQENALFRLATLLGRPPADFPRRSRPACNRRA